MNFRYLSFSNFDVDIPRPLHGYVQRLRGGFVPVWVLPVTVGRDTLRQWLHSVDGQFETETGARFPDGISAVPLSSRAPKESNSPLEFEVKPSRYVEIKRAVAAKISDPYIRVPLAVSDSRRNQFQEGRQQTIPAKINRRLESITEAPAWEEKCQAMDFKGWFLTYEVGIKQPRESTPARIKSVAIEAQFR
ncbi:hypothetical protein D3D01_15600 [Haloarcula sp. Atlit-7R]|nr:hypothetical protein D3D01_15600 [Haloarcula sp. Atlit-7R]